MRVNLKLVVLFGLALACLWVPKVDAYNTATHAEISAHAYLDAGNIEANFFTALAPNDAMRLLLSAVNALTDGSVREDNDHLVNTTNFPYPYARVLYHFFDPLGPVIASLPTGVYNLTGGLQFSGGGCSATTSVSWLWGIAGVGEGAGSKLKLNLNFSSYNEWPWIMTNLGNAGITDEHGAVAYFFQGLTSANSNDRATQLENMFESLGHVIHLLQDAAQPQHVRNDSHLTPPWWAAPLADVLCGSNPSDYETYVENHFGNNPQWFTGYAPPVFAPNPLGPYNFFASIAQFTNSNFVSRGTNCTMFPTASCSIAAPCDCGSHTSATSGYSLSYPQPNFSGPPATFSYTELKFDGNTDACLAASSLLLGQVTANILCRAAEVTFYPTTVTDLYTGKSMQNTLATTSSIFDFDLMKVGASPKFTLNNYNYDSQAAILVPMAEGYSAGLLNYFFRGSMTAGGNSNGFTITNNTKNGGVAEDMFGQFSLYFDDTSGNRSLAGGPWVISVPGAGTASADINGNPLTVTPPEIYNNPQPANPGQYILVFQGFPAGADSDSFGWVTGAAVTIPSAPQ